HLSAVRRRVGRVAGSRYPRPGEGWCAVRESESVAPQPEESSDETPAPSGRLLHILGAVVVGVVLPALLVGALVGELGVSALFIGVVWGVAGAKLGGTRRLTYLTPAIGVIAGLAAYTAYDWWWVALLAATGVVAGAGYRVGWFGALLIGPYAATFVTPVST